ncbi:MAG: type IV pilus modification protein PilV [Methylomonas sp.]|nr:type IV pilus modification protein PilV [Methylomonas sp.]
MNKNEGFTLVEVSVATVVLAVGLLGLAALQASNLKNNQSAYFRSQATQLAYDIADRMRANAGAAGNYLSASMKASEATQQADCSKTDGCEPEKMAENDLYEWQTALAGNLPLGTGEISLAGDIVTVTVGWDDNHDGEVDAKDPNFQMSFQL